MKVNRILVIWIVLFVYSLSNCDSQISQSGIPRGVEIENSISSGTRHINTISSKKLKNEVDSLDWLRERNVYNLQFTILNSCDFDENYSGLQDTILKLDKIKINTSIMFIESRAKTLFNFWANTIKKKGTTPKKRERWLTIYRCYLYFALFVISPIVLTIYTLLFRPFLSKSIRRKKDYFCSIKIS